MTNLFVRALCAAFLCSLLVGCVASHTPCFSAKGSDDGSPLPGVAVVATSSEFLYLWPQDARTPVHRLQGATDKEGMFYVRYTLERQRSVIARLFGADRIPEQHLTLEFTDKQGRTFTSTFYVWPD